MGDSQLSSQLFKKEGGVGRGTGPLNKEALQDNLPL